MKKINRLVVFTLLLLVATSLALHGQTKPDEAKKVSSNDVVISRLDFKDTPVVNAIRLISKATNTNIVASQEAGEKRVTLYLQNVTVHHAIDTISRISGLWYQRDEVNRTYRLQTVKEYQKNLVIDDKEEIKIFRLLYPNPVTIARMIEDLYGDRVELSYGLDKDDDAFELDLDNRATGGTNNSNDNNNRFSRDSQDTGRFARSNRSQQNSQQNTQQLTPDQIAQLELQLQQAENASQINAALINRLTRNKPNIYISVLRSQNVIAVRTSDSNAIKSIEKLIKQLDKPTPQVLLEMKIIEVTLGDNFNSIFDIEFAGGNSSSGPASSTPANPLLLTSSTGLNNILGLGNFALEPSSTLIYQFLNNDIRARLQLLKTNNRLDILSTPMVLASNDRASRLFVGEERVITTGAETQIVTAENGVTTTVIQPTTEVRDIGNSLLVLPKINADGTVTMVIQQDASTVNPNGSDLLVAGGNGQIERVPIDTVNTATLDVTVTAKNGLTVAIGGLVRQEVGDSEEKVPLLGDIPVIGQAFRKEVKTRAKKELVLLVTPHLVQSKEEIDAVKNKVKGLSSSPYYKEGDKALDKYFKNVSDHSEPFEWMKKPFEKKENVTPIKNQDTQ